jgi:hypothetical protein
MIFEGRINYLAFTLTLSPRGRGDNEGRSFDNWRGDKF